MDQDQVDSVDLFVDPPKKYRFRISVDNETDNEEREEIILESEDPLENPNDANDGITIWTRNETLALINIVGLHKHEFKDFKKKKDRWKLVSKKLAEIGIHKFPEKCNIKWRNMLRIYRQYKKEKKGRGKFEFFKELDSVISNDPQFKFQVVNFNGNNTEETKLQDSIDDINETPELKKRKCFCLKSGKQMRHEDRIALMKKKLEIEERKVKAFEDYLQFLKMNSKT